MRALREPFDLCLLRSPLVRERLRWLITASFVVILALARGFYTVWMRVSGERDDSGWHRDPDVHSMSKCRLA